MVFLKEYKIYAVIWEQDKTTLWEPNNFPQIKLKSAERLQNKDTISMVVLLDKENFLEVIYLLAFEVTGSFTTVERKEKGFSDWGNIMMAVLRVSVGTNSFRRCHDFLRLRNFMRKIVCRS